MVNLSEIMKYTISVSNQKGGVGKTTTSINLGACLAMSGKRTLIIDIDPQANATTGLGLEPEPEQGIYQALIEEELPEGIIKETGVDDLFLIPSDINLIGAEVELIGSEGREYRLKTIIDNLDDSFDFVIIDCPPSLGVLTINALTASNSVMVPLQTEYFALEGLRLLMNTIEMVRGDLNPDLEIEGVLFTMFDGRTTLSNQVVSEVREHFRSPIFETVIPRNIRLSEAPSHGIPIHLYDSRSKGADAYIDLARELIKSRNEKNARLNEEQEAAGEEEEGNEVGNEEESSAMETEQEARNEG